MSLSASQTLLFSVIFFLTAWQASIGAPFSHVLIPSALDIPGELSAGLQLVLDPSKGYSIGNRRNHSAAWRFKLFFPRSSAPKTIKIITRGFLQIELRGGSSQTQRLELDSENWVETEVGLVELLEEGLLFLDFRFVSAKMGQVAAFHFDKESVPFDEYFDYAKVNWKPAKQESSPFPLGVNFEAEYLFGELDSQLRNQLVSQALDDGFKNFRLHKLYRIYQKLGWLKLKPMLESFLELLNAKGIDLYLDLLSYPEGNGFEEGWKQSFFLVPELQAKLTQWLAKLNEIQVDGASFFRWKGLKFICLVNENSLFHEESDGSLKLLLAEFTQAVTEEGFQSLNSFKMKRMCSVYHFFQKKLEGMGFNKIFFLSNYQAGGLDLEAQKACSSNVDRHFYLDYPQFHGPLTRVQNSSPIFRLDETLRLYQELMPSNGAYISEFNLPWPNRFQHELVPLVLYLMKQIPIKGLWFYDYRLRTRDFHAGGIFGIQRFRSIIEQLPFFRLAVEKGYRVVKAEPGALKLAGANFFVESGNLEQEGFKIPMTRWVIHGQVHQFSLEKAELDRFDWFANSQTRRGKIHVELSLEKLNK